MKNLHGPFEVIPNFLGDLHQEGLDEILYLLPVNPLVHFFFCHIPRTRVKVLATVPQSQAAL